MSARKAQLIHSSSASLASNQYRLAEAESKPEDVNMGIIINGYEYSQNDGNDISLDGGSLFALHQSACH